MPLLGGADLRKIAGRPGRGPLVRLLRRPADGQRPPPSGPLSDAGDQGPLSPLSHDAGLPLRPQGRLGHPRPARRGRGLQGAGHPLKEEIEAFGVEPFIHKCLQSVFRYTQQWEQLTERLGFWIHLDEAYVTYHQSYVESVWWALTKLFNRGLLYQGHKIVWWWAQGGTALSCGEVGQGYREVADPSVYVRFPAWSTPGKPDRRRPAGLDHHALDAAEQPVRRRQARAGLLASSSSRASRAKLIMASALVETIAAKVGKKYATVVVDVAAARDLSAAATCRRSTTTTRPRARSNGPSSRRAAAQHVAWRVVPADFVTIDTGTGVVHQAPAFGEVDYDVLLPEQALFVQGRGRR